MVPIASYRNIISVAFPIVLGVLAENVINVTDTLFISRINDAMPGALGAVGIGGLYYYTFVLIALGLAMGTQIISGRRNGEQAFEKAGQTLTSSLYLFFIIGLALFLILQFVTPLILPYIVSAQIYPMARQYIQIRSYGILFLCLAIAMRSFLIGVTSTGVIIIITSLMAVTNIVFNYLLIFGKAGFPQLNVAGSALASVIAEFTALAGYLLVCLYWKKLKKYKLMRLRRPDWPLAGSILKVGLPLMLQSWISVSSWLVFFLLIDKMGTHELDVSTIIKSLYILFMIPIWGLASTANTLVSNALGMGRPELVKVISRRVIFISLGFTLLIVQATLFYPEYILHFFSSSQAIIHDSARILRIVSAALVLLSIGGVLFHTVSGTGATRVSLYIELATLSLYFAYMLVVTLVLHLPLEVAWLSEIVYMGCMAIFSFAYLRTGRWKKFQV